MPPATRREQPTATVVDFDEAMLDACPARVRDDLMGEAALLIQAFAPDGEPEALSVMAKSLSMGSRDGEIDRHHARRLAAALRRLIRLKAA